jgi:WD40 repeat protein
VLSCAQVVRAQTEEEGKPTMVVETGGHSAPIWRVLFTPKSKEMITASLDKTVHIWDVATGKLLRTIRPPQALGESGEMWDAALSADGKLLAVTGRGYPHIKQYPIFVIDVPTGQLVRTIEFPYGAVRSLALSGKNLAAGGTDGRIVLFNIDTGAKGKEFPGHKGGTTQMVFGPKGNRLASVGHDKIGRVWSVTDGTQHAELDPGEKLHAVRTIAWSAEHDMIAAAVAEDKHTHANHFAIWTPKGKLVRRIYHVDKKKAMIRSLAFTPDSKGIIAAGMGEGHAFVMRWDAKTGQHRQTFFDKDFNNEETPLYPVTVSPDGRLLAVAGDRNYRTYLYDMNGKLVRTMGGKGRQITEVGWVDKSGTQPLQIVWRTGLLNDKVRDLKPKQLPKDYFQYSLSFEEELQLTPVPPPPYRLRYTEAKGIKLELAHAEVKVERAGKMVPALRPPGTEEDWVHTRSLTLVGADLAVFAKRHGVYVYDTHSGKSIHSGVSPDGSPRPLTLFGPDGVTRSIAPSPENRYVAAGGDDQVLRIWEPKHRKPLLSIFFSGRDWVAWTPAGYYAASPAGARLVGWHVNNGYQKLGSFYPIGRFSKQFHRPDVIALVLQQGSVNKAVEVADAALGKKARAAPAIDQLIPPKVTMVVDDSKKPEITIQAEAVAGTAQQPITSLRLYMDGRPFHDPKTIANFGMGIAKAQAPPWKITLPEGDHALSVQAKCDDVSSFSDPYAVAGNIANPPTMHVLSVGINNYNDPALALGLAVNDATALAQAFSKHCQGPLFGKVDATPPLLNQQANKQAVLKAIKAVRDKAKDNDLFVFTFAGHGVKSKDQYYLLTVEANLFKLENTALSGKELREAVAEFPCQVLLMLDACHSAGFGAGGKIAKAGLRPATDEASRTLTDDEIGVAVMCAAMGSEKAIEMKEHGLFTQAVLDALAGGPKVPRHAFNNKIYIHHIHSYVFDQVSGISEDRQHPLLNLPWIVESFPLR